MKVWQAKKPGLICELANEVYFERFHYYDLHLVQATVLLLVFLLSATVVVSESKGTFRFAEVDSNMSLKDDFINHLNASDQGLEDSIANFFNNSRSKLLNALKNFSSYLPISVEYAMTKGQNCDIIKYNKPFYHVIPLILAAVIIVLGAVFTYVGKSTNLYNNDCGFLFLSSELTNCVINCMI